ncbi:MAG: hypothetical protein ABI854_09930, partial [Betaproteobacteria bacterium]
PRAPRSDAPRERRAEPAREPRAMSRSSVPRSDADHAASRTRDKSHYDLNPDQPLPRSQPAGSPTPGASGTSAASGERRGPAVPALLRKRPQPA